MGKKIKAGLSGNAVQYVTRNQALKRLQLKLSDFRRLCILKGVSPREPKKKTKGRNKTYYHVKDINFLAHEPLLNQFRDLHAYEKKIKKAKAKKNRDLAGRLVFRKPSYRLDHLVKERYPSFTDALRDLDDPLTLTHLFAGLPAERRHGLPVDALAQARRLSLEWQAYIGRTHALRKVFASVKGFYFQAEVLGQMITWLVPHQLAQVLPDDVDYKVMLTFLEFYRTLLQFVNFKLYHMLGLRYPPLLQPHLEAAAADLAALVQSLGPPTAATHPHPTQPTAPSSHAAPAAAQPSARDPLSEPQAAQQPISNGAAASGDEEADGDGDTDEDMDEDGAGSVDSGASGMSSGAEEEQQLEAEAAAELDTGGAAVGRPDGLQQAGSQPGSALIPSTMASMGPDQDGHEEEEGEAGICGRLFRGLVFFVGREVPQEQLLLVIRSFGGTAAWDGPGSPLAEADESITHQVVDRPVQSHKFMSREYVQPQWVLDSANFRVHASTVLYAPGRTPPPHLSPFASTDEEDYVPDYLVAMRKLQEASKAAQSGSAAGAAEARFLREAEEAAQAEDGEQDPVVLAERAYAAELARETQVQDQAPAGDTSAEEDVEAEVQPEQPQTAAEARAAKVAQAAREAADMESTMLPRKKRKMYKGLQERRSAKRADVAALQAKARKLAVPVQ